MLHERISLNGRHTVGFGDGNVPLTSLDKPLIGFLAGVTGGAIVGAIVGKGVGAAVGAVAGAIGGAAVGFAINEAHAAPASTTQMLPGQVWTTVGVVRPTKTWTADSKRAVEDAVTLALAKIGLTVLDGTWSGDYTLTVGVQPNQVTTLASGTTLPLASEWANQVAFSNIAQAPANPPGAK